MADVVDLFVSERCRLAGTFYLLLCDGQDRVALPVAVDDIQTERPEDCEVLLWPFLEVMRSKPDGGLLLALGRPGPAHLTDLDRQWREAAVHACARVGVRLLGLYVATPEGVLHATAGSDA